MALYTATKYNFKSSGCDELVPFDIAFAVKEPLQNTTSQILKALEVRKWRDWERLDLQEETGPIQQKRQRTKARLIISDPYIFAGEQGKALARSKLAEPLYVLEATIPADEIKGHRQGHDLRAVIILWGFKGALEQTRGPRALTIYNNYLDPQARFSHFVHDGASTSKGSYWAIGLKGKGFILAMSYLAQQCQDLKASFESSAEGQNGTAVDFGAKIFGMNKKHMGVGFNVGSRFGKGAYDNSSPSMLQMRVEDLRALNVEEFRHENPRGYLRNLQTDGRDESDAEMHFMDKADDWYLDRLKRTHKKRLDLRLAEKVPDQQDGSLSNDFFKQRPLVHEDDVCIHVIGLPETLDADQAFSAVYGIVNEPKVGRIPGTQFEISEGKNRFYHRDQLVQSWVPLSDFSINYHGNLRLSSDRMVVIEGNEDYQKFKGELEATLHKAVGTMPDLACAILKNMLHTEDLRTVLKPSSRDYQAQYKHAFEAACPSQAQIIYPYVPRDEDDNPRDEDDKLIGELGYHPLPLKDWRMEILVKAGAYVPIKEHARAEFLKVDKVPDSEIAGLDQMIRIFDRLAPGPSPQVCVQKWQISYPKTICKDNCIYLAQRRPCGECPQGKCSCWMGPALIRALWQCGWDVNTADIFREVCKEQRYADNQARKSSKPAPRKTTLHRTSTTEVGSRLHELAKIYDSCNADQSATVQGELTRLLADGAKVADSSRKSQPTQVTGLQHQTKPDEQVAGQKRRRLD